MKKLLFSLIMALMPFLLYSQCGNLYIAGVIDGPLTGGTPKGIQVCASGAIADLSIYGIGSANNGGGTDGEEFTFPNAALNAGECVWLASEADQFAAFFGFDACYTSGVAGINGDDAIELFCSGAVVDVFGDIATDGTGQPWEYTDGWAVSSDMVASTTFDANWTYSGVNALDNETDNASATNPYPNAVDNCPVAILDCPALGLNIGDDCDDMDAGTYADVVDANCMCVGTAYDCPTLSLNIGDSCDDGDAATLGDVVDANCMCAGTAPDCPTLMLNIGDACNDNDPGTSGDEVDANCDCVGTPITGGSDLYFSELSFNPCGAQGADSDCEYIIISNNSASAIDIGDYTLSNGITYIFPTGTMVPANGSLSVGVSDNCAVFTFDLTAFSGSLSNSTDETIDLNDASGALVTSITYVGNIGDGDCNAQCFDLAGGAFACASSIEQAPDCPTLGLNIGASCDDMDAGTFGDAVDANCMCVGTPYDCPTEMANFGDACDDGDAATINDLILSDCTCAGDVPSSECPAAFINEFHYDNAGGDLNEFVEIAVPVGADASGLEVNLYNGNGGTVYFTASVGATPTGSDANYDYYVIDITGAQNGNDGISLSCADQTVLDFISYEGPFDATDGPAAGMTATDVGVAESGTTTDSQSIQFDGTAWGFDCASTPGATNDLTTCNVTTFDCEAEMVNFNDPCDDGDAATTNDVIQSDCTCAGEMVTFDCEIEMVNFGDSCDDGDAMTVNDAVDSTCVCVGIPVVSSDLYISELSFNPCTAQGTDGDCEYIVITNSGTSDIDVSDYTISNAIIYTFPAGTMIPAGGSLSLGISGDCVGFNFDLNGGWSGSLSNSNNETVELNDTSGALVASVTYDGTIADGDCDAQCFDAAGTPSACVPSVVGEVDCPALGLNIGSSCDDGDAATFGDAVDANCMCVGTPYDCPMEMVNFGDACDDMDPMTVNDTINTSCECVGIIPSSACPAAFINEFHYDNDGGDVNEFVEIAVPIGDDASGLVVTLYNGNGGVEYNSIAVGTASPAGSDATYDYYVIDITGAQNGNDGIALSCADGTVLDFISYEGAFDATDGPAMGMTATDVGVAESSSGPSDVSLQLIDGVWQEPCTATPGATNDTTSCFVAPCESDAGNFPWTGN